MVDAMTESNQPPVQEWKCSPGEQVLPLVLRETHQELSSPPLVRPVVRLFAPIRGGLGFLDRLVLGLNAKGRCQ